MIYVSVSAVLSAETVAIRSSNFMLRHIYVAHSSAVPSSAAFETLFVVRRNLNIGMEYVMRPRLPPVELANRSNVSYLEPCN